jgi:hypothetical protein
MTAPPGAVFKFLSGTEVAYSHGSGGVGGLFKLDLTTGRSSLVASWPGGASCCGGQGAFAFSPDGRSVVYTYSDATSLELRLLTGGSDRVLASLLPQGGRGGGDNDSFFLEFSADGRYFALVETFHLAAAGDQSPFQIRQTDGTLVLAGAPDTPWRTHAAWGGSPTQLYFRSFPSAGAAPSPLLRWEPSTGITTVVPDLNWLSPKHSPGGRLFTYTIRSADFNPHAGLIDRNDATRFQNIGGDLRYGARFINATTIWYDEHMPCLPPDSCGLAGPTRPTGRHLIYDLNSQRESPSSIASPVDTWPR